MWFFILHKMEMNLFENYPNNKINFEEQWQSSEWRNLETHTQLSSKKKFTSFLLHNLQVWELEYGHEMLDRQTESLLRINHSADSINSKLCVLN